MAAGLTALVALYLLAGLTGAVIPANPAWKQAQEGVRVYVIDNGIHSDIALPRATLGPMLAARLRPGDLADPRQAMRSHVAFGWGDRDFYLNTPTWAEVNPLRVGRALVGAGQTVMHISHIDEPRAGPRARVLVLRPDELGRLRAYLQGSFGEGRPVRGYGANDAFYVARGGYSLLHTCNGWTGAALRHAGVRTGVWTPFASGVMLWR